MDWTSWHSTSDEAYPLNESAGLNRSYARALVDNLLCGQLINDTLELAFRKKMEELEVLPEEVPNALITINRVKYVTQLSDQPLCVVDEPAIILKKNKVCHPLLDVNLLEQKTKYHYVDGSQGISVRIVKGMYYRVGAMRGERIPEDYVTRTDSGTLCVTNKRVCFIGTKKTSTIPLNAITAIVKHDNAVQIQKANETRVKFFETKYQFQIEAITIVVTRLISDTEL